MIAFWSALILVTAAEMGDKTQLLAVAFAARFSWKTVMWGVFAATLLNHLLAVWVGSWLTSVIPMHAVSMGASLSFVLFGLWMLRGDKLQGEEDKKESRSPFWTVAAAFFMAEMGDKTQLATIALAAQFHTVIPVWAGTTTGMMIADGAGILLGGTLGRRVSARTIRLGGASVFILCGFWGLSEFL